MMSLFSQIYRDTKTAHNEAENKIFILRYRQHTHTLADHYRHLTQLLPIYQVLEKKMNDPNFFIRFPKHLRFLLVRSKKIIADLEFLQRHCSNQLNDQPLASTETYVAYLDALNIKENATEILAHFLTRILGDLNGGQQLKKYVHALFDRAKIHVENENGVTFYSFEKTTLSYFLNWMNTHLVLENEMELIQFINQAFHRHSILFDELERTRYQRLTMNNCCNFFTKVAVVSAVMYTAGVAFIAMQSSS